MPAMLIRGYREQKLTSDDRKAAPDKIDTSQKLWYNVYVGNGQYEKRQSYENKDSETR